MGSKIAVKIIPGSKISQICQGKIQILATHFINDSGKLLWHFQRALLNPAMKTSGARQDNIPAVNEKTAG